MNASKLILNRETLCALGDQDVKGIAAGQKNTYTCTLHYVLQGTVWVLVGICPK